MKVVGIVVLSILAVLSLIVIGVAVKKSVNLTQNCTSYLEVAANANSIELAKENLGHAIKYAEEQGYASGYTSVVYKTEDENVGFWYNNLKAAYQELDTIDVNATPLEKSNVLMKLRESLIKHNGDGETIIIPGGLYVYPNNLLWGILLGLAIPIVMIEIMVVVMW